LIAGNPFAGSAKTSPWPRKSDQPERSVTLSPMAGLSKRPIDLNARWAAAAEAEDEHDQDLSAAVHDAHGVEQLVESRGPEHPQRHVRALDERRSGRRAEL
jgi:hypothetical protein